MRHVEVEILRAVAMVLVFFCLLIPYALGVPMPKDVVGAACFLLGANALAIAGKRILEAETPGHYFSSEVEPDINIPDTLLEKFQELERQIALRESR